jgi:hypothetical protein
MVTSIKIMLTNAEKAPLGMTACMVGRAVDVAGRTAGRARGGSGIAPCR